MICITARARGRNAICINCGKRPPGGTPCAGLLYGFAGILKKENEMKKTGILITLMVLAAVPAAAQDRAGTFEISP